MENNILSLENKVALITGASSGLGAHFASVLSKAGAKVVLGARRLDKLHSIAASINAKGGCCSTVTLDVTCAESVSNALDKAEKQFGAVTLLINNAGITESARFTKIEEQSWDHIMDTNLKGAWRVASNVSQRLISKGIGGSIINIASILGLRVGFGEGAYAISKAGVVHMTKAMALELGRSGIRVNALCPGYFKTELNAEYFESDRGREFIKQSPAQRLGQRDELNAPLLLLCSDASSFINGITLPVDGGHLISSL